MRLFLLRPEAQQANGISKLYYRLIKMKRILTVSAALMIALIFSQAAFAAKATNRSVVEIIVSNNGKATIKLSGADVNPAACQNTPYVIEADAVVKKEWLAQLLTAKAAGFNVTLSINDTVCANDNKNPKISNIIVL